MRSHNPLHIIYIRIAAWLFALCLCAYAPSTLKAQDDTYYRLELGIGAGCGFGINDLNSKIYGQTGGAAQLIARFPINARMAIKTSVSYLRVSGDSSGQDDFYPANQQATSLERAVYKAKGSLFDIGAMYELHLLPYGWQRSYQGYKRVVPYLQLGFGLTYSHAGKAFTANMPVGFGVKWKVADRVNVGLSWTFHFTPSDKLDGVKNPHGISSASFRNKDHYNLTLVSLTYDLSPKCPSCNKDR